MHAVFFSHNLEQRQNVFAQCCEDNYNALTQNTLINVCWLQRPGICTSSLENLLRMKEVMNNFLNRPVRIQVRTNQNQSHDSQPCLACQGNVTGYPLDDNLTRIANRSCVL